MEQPPPPPEQARTTSRQPDLWTTRRLLNWTTDYFTRKGIEFPRRSAEMLLAHVLHLDHWIKLNMDLDRPANDFERMRFRELVERAAEHEPIDYLIGSVPFFTLRFEVTPAVLSPRPSTETVVEHIIQHSRVTPGFRTPVVADVGTGSGVIAISLAKFLPGCRVIATDVSEAALEVARKNASTLGVSDAVEFRQGDLLGPLAGERVHYLVSNPPYISDAEWADVPPNVKDYEPEGALRGGHDGLDYLRPLIAGAADYLESPGQLVLEIAASQKAAVLELAEANRALSNAHVLADHEALPRVLVADVQADEAT